jgi:hypothetical protein
MKRACWHEVRGFVAMFVNVEGLIGWSLRRAFSSDDSSHSSSATLGQLMPSSVRLPSSAE